jgi:uncharacterized protein with von Willebrand factor type A (vWA) domain
MEGARVEFIFLVDRSGSMDGDRMLMTRKVLNELLDHLPSDAYFNIISFGSKYQFLFTQSKPVGEEYLYSAKRQISSFKADLGGTEIFRPLAEIINSPKLLNYDRVVFLITDGQVNNEDGVISLIRNNPTVRIQSVGIGNGVSKNLIMETAIEGKGKFEFVSDEDLLRDKMLYLLEDSITPFLEEFVIEYDKDVVLFGQDI